MKKAQAGMMGKTGYEWVQKTRVAAKGMIRHEQIQMAHWVRAA